MPIFGTPLYLLRRIPKIVIAFWRANLKDRDTFEAGNPGPRRGAAEEAGRATIGK